MSDSQLEVLFDQHDPNAEPAMPATFVQRTVERGRRRTRRRHTIQAITTGGAAAVAVLAIGSTAMFGAGSATSAGRPPAAAGQPITAATLLHQMSLVADEQHVTVHPGQYVRVRGVVKSQDSTAKEHHVRTSVYQIFWPTDDNHRVVVRRGDRLRLVKDNKPHPSIDEPTYEFAKSLPTDPTALMRLIRAAAKAESPSSPDRKTFELIHGLLNIQILPDGLASALYTDLARLPGITLVHDAVDASGRHGTGVSMTDAKRNLRDTIIFDSKAHRYLGFKVDDPRTGTYQYWWSMLKADVVNSVG